MWSSDSGLGFTQGMPLTFLRLVLQENNTLSASIVIYVFPSLEERGSDAQTTRLHEAIRVSLVVDRKTIPQTNQFFHQNLHLAV